MRRLATVIFFGFAAVLMIHGARAGTATDSDRANVDARPTSPAPAEASPSGHRSRTEEKKSGKTDVDDGRNFVTDPDRGNIPGQPNMPH
jgi:hypothetical protein